jgi:SdrD B-like domain
MSAKRVLSSLSKLALFGLVLMLATIALPHQAAATGCTNPAAIGDFVWNDLNRNGIQDSGEPGIAGVTVELYKCDKDILVASTVTDASGYYLFSGLEPGSYYVKFYAPMGCFFTQKDQGCDDALDSDADTETGKTICTELTACETDRSWDAGVYCPVKNPGTGTPGYWKNHPEAWPVEDIVIGGNTYSKDSAITYFMAPVRGDKTITMFRALVSAKLNVLIGNDSSCISATIAAADAWMAAHPVGSNVDADSMAWKEGEPLYKRLDQYNNGYLCAPHRD